MDLKNELRQAFRNLFRKPTYTILVIGMMAIGIAVTGTIFSLINALLLRPLPVNEPSELMRLYVQQDGKTVQRISFPDYMDFRSRSDVFEDAIATSLTAITVESQSVSEQILGEVVSANYFSTLGISVVPGRTFGGPEEVLDSAKSAIISYRLWQRVFHSNPQIIGKQIRMNGEMFTIIGIASKQFSGTFAGAFIDAWIPITQVQWLGVDALTNRIMPSVRMIGRLKKGTSSDKASAIVSSVALQLEKAYPRTESKRTGAELVPATLLHGGLRKGVSVFLSIMLGISGLVLFTSVANVANLVLISAADKRREIAVRFALGAGRFSILRQFLIENVILTLCAGISGFLVSIWCGTILQKLNPIPTVPIQFDLGPDPRVFGFLMSVSILMGILLGLVPQFQIKTTNLLPVLQSEPGRTTSGGHTSRLRSLFVISQVSFSLIILVGAALFLQSLRNASFMNPGFQPDKAMAVDIDLKTVGLTEQQGREFYRLLLERVSRLPSVESVALADLAPMDIATFRTPIHIDGHQSAPGQPVFQISSNRVTSNYFKTLGIKLIGGSDFTTANHNDSELVAIINEQMAKRFWPNENAIGKTFRLAEGNRVVTIYGLAKNVKYRTLAEEPEPHIYLAFEQLYDPSMSIFVRTQRDPAQLLDIVQREVRSIRPDVQGFFARTLEQHTSFALLPARVAAWLSGVFGFIALILSVLGIYGTVGYSVAIRTREIGIRAALGAKPSQILRWTLSNGMRITGLGLVVGLLLAFVATRVLSGFLFGISAFDPITFAGVLFVLMLAAFFACYIPARRAMCIDPATALRDT